MIKRICSILLVIAFCLSGIPFAAQAEEPDIHIFFNDTEIAFQIQPDTVQQFFVYLHDDAPLRL